MELFEISVDYNNEHHHYEVRDYMHHEGDNDCKYEVYKKGVFVASFEPGPHKHLHVCKDAGVEQEHLLNLLMVEIEKYNI